MHVLLLNNPGAGAGRPVGTGELRQLLERHGHTVRPLSTDDDGWRDAIREGSEDVVAVAGGDGTLREVLTALAGSDAAVGVVATGTANNIAHSIGAPVDDPASSVEGWHRASTLRFDVPSFRTDGGRHGPGSSRLVESLGGGVFAELLAVAEEREERVGEDGGTEDGLRLLRRVLRSAVPQAWEVVLDGRDLSGEYLAVEAMNIRRIGPNVELAPDADPGDGLVDLVLVGEDDRATLAGHVDDLLRVGTPGEQVGAPELHVRRGRLVELRPPPGCHLHVDDEHWVAAPAPGGGSEHLALEVDGTALQLLVPGLSPPTAPALPGRS
ncbi:MAG TPA: diacylglycerol kinase family protein [Microthrixaceae bacterium]|nr:diacylglycerol kinase family protein [Microthrixaceae bacterium]